MADWHPEDIKAELRKRGLTLSAIARRMEVTTQAISLGIQGRCSEKIEVAVATALDVEAHEIWPSRYDAAGNRILFRDASARGKVHA